MARKNIFEMVAEIFDVSIELNRLYRLFEKRGTVNVYPGVHTLRGYIKDKGFSTKLPNILKFFNNNLTLNLRYFAHFSSVTH